MASPIFLGPLTTTFTPPPSCFSLTALVDSAGVPFQMYTGGFADAELQSSPFPGTYCFPSVYPATAGDNWGPYFSPGVCPVGYTVASSTVNNSETRGVCCVSGLTANDFLNCQTSVTSSLTASEYVMVKPSGPFPLELGVKVGSSLLLIGSAIEIRWREGGNPPATLPPQTATYTPPSTSASFSIPSNTAQGHTFTVAGLTTSPYTGTGTGTPSPQATSLSTEAKIGIGVGVAAAVLVALGTVVIFYLRRRSQRLAAARA